MLYIHTRLQLCFGQVWEEVKWCLEIRDMSRIVRNQEDLSKMKETGNVNLNIIQ